MQLDGGGVAFAATGPREETRTQMQERGIEGEGRCGQIDRGVLLLI